MRQSMKGDDGGRSGDKNKVTRNPSYDKKRDTEAGVQKRLSELVRDHCSSHGFLCMRAASPPANTLRIRAGRTE